MAHTKVKRELVEKKEKWGIVETIDKMDIVGLVTYRWERSFQTERLLQSEDRVHFITSNSYIPNYTQEIKNIHRDSKIQPDELNLANGIAVSLMENIILFQSREAAQTGENATAM